MSYSLFLDDERLPPKNQKVPFGNWVIARNYQQAIEIINKKGMPRHISFDHDLGQDQKTGKDLANWLIEADMDQNIDLSQLDSFNVHSANPVGRSNIESLLNNYLNFKKINKTNPIF